MPHNPLIAFCMTTLVALGGCATIEKDKRANALETTLATYGEAIRWGYFETAYGYVHPGQRKGLPSHLDNVRVTGYDVVQPPRMKDETSAEQVVRIQYVHQDRQRLRSLSDRQLWQYDTATDNWWLRSGIPQFN